MIDIKVSVIVLNYNGKKYVEPCLRSVLNTNWPSFEVIFVDNGSNDDSLKIVEERFGFDPRLKIIALRKNVGYTKGNNTGFKHAKGKYVVFLNVDTEVTKSWLVEILKILEKDLDVGAVQPKLLLMNEEGLIDSLGALIDVLGTPRNIGHLRNSNEIKLSSPFEIFYAKGAALVIRRELFRQIGRFDDDFFLLRDEADLCWRVWLHGYKVVCVPSSTVFHHGSAIIDKEVANTKLAYYFVRNNIVTLIKNYSANNLLKYLPLSLLLQAYSAIINSISSKNPSYIAAYLNGLKWNLTNIRKTLQKRKYVQKFVRKKKDSALIGKVIRPVPFFFSTKNNKLACVKEC